MIPDQLGETTGDSSSNAESLTIFTLFPKLPQEIRLMIRGAQYTGPRIVHLELTPFRVLRYLCLSDVGRGDEGPGEVSSDAPSDFGNDFPGNITDTIDGMGDYVVDLPSIFGDTEDCSRAGLITTAERQVEYDQALEKYLKQKASYRTTLFLTVVGGVTLQLTASIASTVKNMTEAFRSAGRYSKKREISIRHDGQILKPEVEV